MAEDSDPPDSVDSGGVCSRCHGRHWSVSGPHKEIQAIPEQGELGPPGFSRSYSKSNEQWPLRQ